MSFEVASAEPRGDNLIYKTKQEKEGVTYYAFSDVVVVIDTTGKNYTKLPEMLFVTLRKEDGNYVYKMERPDGDSSLVGMERVAACITKVAHDIGQEELWFYPFNKDGKDKESTERARVRLFSKYIDIIPEESGYGFIMRFGKE